jgi:hypothetical protein
VVEVHRPSYVVPIHLDLVVHFLGPDLRTRLFHLVPLRIHLGHLRNRHVRHHRYRLLWNRSLHPASLEAAILVPFPFRLFRTVDPLLGVYLFLVHLIREVGGTVSRPDYQSCASAGKWEHTFGRSLPCGRGGRLLCSGTGC